MFQTDNETDYEVQAVGATDRDGRNSWVVAVKATFDLLPGGRIRRAETQIPILMTPEYTGEDGASSVRYESDLHPSKPGVDLVVNGDAHAPGGRPQTRVEVGVRVGSWSKELVIHGPRTYGWSLQPGPPAPFVTLPIVYERAYGGFDKTDPRPERQTMHDLNPVGCGLVRVAGAPVPNIEYRDAGKGRGQAAGFGVIASHWSPRRQLAGTFDAKWVEERKPLLPANFDPRFHHFAPADQQFVPGLRGGEPIEIVNLTRDGRSLRTRALARPPSTPRHRDPRTHGDAFDHGMEVGARVSPRVR
jgi:hypothetical protein